MPHAVYGTFGDAEVGAEEEKHGAASINRPLWRNAAKWMASSLVWHWILSPGLRNSVADPN